MNKGDFAALHDSADPLILFNIWDAGSAKAVAKAGAKAIATGSASLAGSQGYDDGEHIPFARVVDTAKQITEAVDLPISVDIEAGFATNLADLGHNAAALRDVGVIGCNLEDRLIRPGGLRSVDEQAERIATINREGLFVNARTDTFLGPWMAGEDPNRAELVDAAIERASIYRTAGAGCFFIPGLSDPALIARLCEAVELPINVMRLPGMANNAELAKLGVARISYGPGPWRSAMAQIEDAARTVFAT
ncbi:isocitrate lyase/PEP mutase family protein [Erythrobacter ani]|uniref:Isocitrate lyase/phosphoenolpyruvate mutase family protein n=1 Tax=Erythrobacter ani TaxID=2827235 RepID=A0ABS6SQD3_9SPHN|nr:isocitrate lyase/phosphoenolpyruvate mutase family protein [Erythrobacter ani]MBV7266603.1 isocitrate lyase/phosphoenolpyruvate mutase family protein [Erythrobacter ani]